jgi:hypothetical protein
MVNLEFHVNMVEQLYDKNILFRITCFFLLFFINDIKKACEKHVLLKKKSATIRNT